MRLLLFSEKHGLQAPTLAASLPLLVRRRRLHDGQVLSRMVSCAGLFLDPFYCFFLFATHSNNMLYPKEDRTARTLYFACRNCDHTEEADFFCVYRNELIQPAVGRHAVVPDLSLDPTLPRTKKVACPRCGFGEAVFFQSHDKQIDSAMTLYFVCCNLSCNHCFVNDTIVQ